MNATTQPPLAQARIIGVERRMYQAAPEAPVQPGGSCWHCGQAIMVCVIVELPEHGRQTIGTTCAERVGMDADQLRQHLAELYADERAARAHARSAEYRRQRELLEQQLEAEHGPHGTAGRYLGADCRCDRCIAAAPHGTRHRFYADTCTCGPCLDWALLGSGDYYVRDQPVLVDLATGEVLADAREVSTRYGYRWRSDQLDVWAPVSPARRDTMAKRGVVSARAPFLTYRGRDRYGRNYWRPVVALGAPIADDWGTPIARPAG